MFENVNRNTFSGIDSGTLNNRLVRQNKTLDHRN